MATVNLNDIEVMRLHDQYGKADEERRRWSGVWDRLYQYAAPHLRVKDSGESYLKRESSGEDLNVHLYDITLAQSTSVFASRLFNGLTPLNQTWAAFEPGEGLNKKIRGDKDKKKAIKAELAEVTRQLFQKLHASNFSQEAGSAFENFAIGTLAFMVTKDKNNPGRPFIFESVNPQLLSIGLSVNKKPENVWRLKHIKIMDIEITWPKAKLTEKLQKKMAEDHNAEVDLIEGTVFQPDKGNFLHIVMEKDQGEDDSVVLSEEDESSPWVIARYSSRDNEAYGRGKAMTAVHAAITLNKIILMGLQSGQLKISPPIMADANSEINIDTFVITPNAIMPVKDIKGIKQFEVADMSSTLEFQIKYHQEQIQSVMLTNPFGPISSPVISATEVSLRNSEVLEQNIMAVGRFTAEFYHTLFDRLLFLSRDLIKRPLTKNMSIRKDQIKMVYKIPLMRIQEAVDLNNFQQYVQVSQLTFGPQLAPLTLDEAKVPEYLSKLLSLPPGMVKSEDEVNELLQEAKKAVQQQQQQQQQAVAPNPNTTANNSIQNAMASSQATGSGIPPTGII